jgi:Cof subfamily protein (haloacid dehalogenase superfamily)
VTFSPKLVALDIDGTLFAPDEGAGTVAESISPGVYDAVQRAVDAGVHVVLATGRSTYGITRVWDMLDLPREGEQVLTVASNGAVTFRYSPVDVLETVTFDASEVVAQLLEHVPQAMVAVEEIGVGYRVNRHFPEGEITGQMQLQSVDELVAEPVTRVIIRDPDASAEQFIELAERLGLHGTNYFIGWTAWLDLAPEGVSKASALASVAQRLGVDQSDVLAIGDGRNDTDMLRWAGRGVAMGQSVDEVKAAADDVAGSVHEDGAAAELNRWL